MTTIPPTNGASTLAGTTGRTPTNPNSMLDKDDFLKLFVVQLQHQDPMAPMDNDQMLSQMSQLSTVEQLTNLVTTNAAMAQSQAAASAVALIGRTVTWVDGAHTVHTGKVEKVTTKDGMPSLTVAGTAGVDPTSITEVA